MKFEYTGRHIEVTPALKTHVQNQFARIDHLFKGSPAQAHVIIEVAKGRHRSEMNVRWRNELLTATTTNSDMYLSLSQTVAKIEKQALKLKTKVIDKSHKGDKAARVRDTASEVAPAPRGARIVRSRRYPVKPMMPEEAALHLDGGADAFLVFRNAESQRISVIYSRKDGNYGLIEP